MGTDLGRRSAPRTQAENRLPPHKCGPSQFSTWRPPHPLLGLVMGFGASTKRPRLMETRMNLREPAPPSWSSIRSYVLRSSSLPENAAVIGAADVDSTIYAAVRIPWSGGGIYVPDAAFVTMGWICKVRRVGDTFHHRWLDETAGVKDADLCPVSILDILSPFTTQYAEAERSNWGVRWRSRCRSNACNVA